MEGTKLDEMLHSHEYIPRRSERNPNPAYPKMISTCTYMYMHKMIETNVTTSGC